MDLNKALFVSDFDGTLLTSDKRISQKNLEAIKKFQDLGGKFSVATGRPMFTVAQYTDQLRYDLPMILCNGGVIYDPYKKEVVWAKFLPDNIMDMVKEIFDKFQSLSPELYSLEDQYYIRMNDVERWHQDILKMEFKKLDNLDSFDKPLCKLLFADDEDVINELCEFVKKYDNFGVRFVRSLSTFLEVLPENVSKAYGMKKLIELYDLTEYKVFSAGDYDNDIEMLKASDIGFCPSNSQNCVIESADVILKASNDENAISEAIKYLICY